MVVKGRKAEKNEEEYLHEILKTDQNTGYGRGGFMSQTLDKLLIFTIHNKHLRKRIVNFAHEINGSGFYGHAEAYSVPSPRVLAT
jgi:hypothetical protein